MAERWTTGFGFRRGSKILLSLYTYNYKAFSSPFGSCHASGSGYSNSSSVGYTGLIRRHLGEPRCFRLCSDLATRWVTENSGGYTELYSLKPPSLLVKFYRDSFPRVKRPRLKAYHSPSSRAKIKNSSSCTSLPAYFHDVKSDFNFSYSFHVNIYFTVQPEPTWSDTQAEKQFHHCYRFSQTLRFAIASLQSTDSWVEETKPTMVGWRCVRHHLLWA